MRKLILISSLALSSFLCSAQTQEKGVKVALDKSGDYVAINVNKDSTVNFTPTGVYFKEKNGNRLPVYETKKGRKFVLSTSKKTGKPYRKYLAVQKAD